MDTITVHGKTYKLPKEPVWRKGPPPEIGWWPSEHLDLLRFWNGYNWSCCVSVFDAWNHILFNAKLPAPWETNQINWTDQWWKESEEPK